MSEPDIQYFGRDGTWVKPAGAACLTVVLKGGGSTIDADGTDNGYEGGGTSFSFFPSGGGGGAGIAAAPSRPGRVNDGELAVWEFPASAWPAQVSVEVGKGGRPGGRDGYVLVITHLEECGHCGEPRDHPDHIVSSIARGGHVFTEAMP
jgi:hypothetical protein